MSIIRQTLQKIASTILSAPNWIAAMAGTLIMGSGLIAALMATQILPVLPVLLPLTLTPWIMALLGAAAISIGLGIFIGLGLRTRTSHPKTEITQEKQNSNGDILQVVVGPDVSASKSLPNLTKPVKAYQRIPHNTPTKSPFLDLPRDIARHIAFFTFKPDQGDLPIDTVHLAKTCRFFYVALQPTLDQIGATKLVLHVIQGEEKKAKLMLEACPGLLSHSVTLTDHTGRTLKNTTAYQAALGALDVDMLKMITPYFARLKQGELERSNQYNKQFPNGLAQPVTTDFRSLIDSISQAEQADIEAQLNLEHRNTQVCHAISAFRTNVESCNVIESGLHFNYQTLVMAYNMYETEHYNWTYQQQDLFWRQIIGYIVRLMPVCDVQACFQGFAFTLNKKESLVRIFKVSLDNFIGFPPADSSGLGFYSTPPAISLSLLSRGQGWRGLPAGEVSGFGRGRDPRHDLEPCQMPQTLLDIYYGDKVTQVSKLKAPDAARDHGLHG